MRFLSKVLFMLPCCLGVSNQADAATFLFSGTLSGANEVPANASSATGSFTATLDDVANSVFVNLSYSGLSSDASAGILHCCAPASGNAGSILIFTGFPGGTSGTYSNTLFGLSNANVDGIKNGLAYINIHTVASPVGEIRAQLIPTTTASVPEPATWAMMIGGFALAGAALRRRKVAVAFR